MLSLVSTRTPRASSPKLLSSQSLAGSSQLLLVPGDAPPQLQHLAFAFAELHDIPVGPFLHSTEVPLGGITASGASTTPLSSSFSANFLDSQLASVAKLLLDILPHKASARTFTSTREASCPGSPMFPGL